LLAGQKEQDLVKWVNGELPDGFFHGTGGKEVTGVTAQGISACSEQKETASKAVVDPGVSFESQL